jgi:predicted MPP superfamily phosphohydrolase
MGLALLLIVLIFLYYACAIEPRQWVVTRHEIRSPFVPAGFDGVRIVQLSDTHISPFHPLRDFERLVDLVNELEPDLCVFTGDLYDARRIGWEGDPSVVPPLARIRAPLGKFAVYGNHDFGIDRCKRRSGPLLEQGGFRVLVNETLRIELPGGEAMTVSGLDDYVLGQPDPKQTLAGLPEEAFHLLLVHEPDAADELTGYPIDLQLSGHSHGGQVSLPLLGAIVRTEYGRKYIAGDYEIAPRRRGSRPFRLYVSRGLGTTRLRVRFGCKPEIAVFTLRREP